MKSILSLLVLSLLCIACNSKKESVDLLVTNAKIYTVNVEFETAEALAAKGGIIVAVGTSEDLQKQYTSEHSIDAKGQTLLPGLIDAHAHLYNLGISMQNVDLVGTTSKAEVLERLVAFQKEKQVPFIYGRGWDQNDWEVKEFPNKDRLDELFPDTPVALTRIDGHAMITNSKALEMAGITAATKMDGGEVLVEDGQPTGILVDTPMRMVRAVMPSLTYTQAAAALKDAENVCTELGLTTVNDAGLSREIIEIIDSLQTAGEMKLRVYAMVSNAPGNLDHFLNCPR